MGMAKAESPSISSNEDYDGESSPVQDSQWTSQEHGADQRKTSIDGSASTPTLPPPRLLQPMPKRRRVTRACDECRRKKIKCDGKQPCTHCTVYSYECTYDQPSNRRRNPAPQYIEAIENRLQKAEALLKMVLPDVDLNDPKFDNGVPQRMHAPAEPSIDAQPPLAVEDGGSTAGSKGITDQENDSLLESMVENTGTLDLDDQGHWDFHGHSSGLIFLRRMREQFGDVLGQGEGHGSHTPFMRTLRITQVLDSPKSTADSPSESNLPNTHDLPPRQVARELVESTLDEACALLRFVHQPTFYALFDKIYDTPPDQYGNEENRFLPLLYVVMAVGCLFNKNENSKLQSEGYVDATDDGFKFFKASRQMMDITDCRDLQSLQAIMFMIMFLQSSAKLATCYSYIGISLRSAIRMGLHRSIQGQFNPIEQETRKRMFWTIRKMDIYVGAILGLPNMLSDDDIDQVTPEEVDDEFITAEKILPMPPGRVSLITATNAHTKLLFILQKVVKYIYPIKGMASSENKTQPSYMVSHAKIREIERDLQVWMENLPMALRPGGDTPALLGRVQQLLRIAYAHVQMVLYRPFLHYVSQSASPGTIDKRSYACAAACVSVSRNIIHITGEMKKRGLLVGAYWFTMYTTFFAILSLLFFILENPDSPTSQDILRDVMEGKDTLARLAKRSLAADRCTVTLNDLMGQIPGKLKNGSLTNVSKKKRQAPPLNMKRERAVQSSIHLPGPNSPSVDSGANIQRASTFPTVPSTTSSSWKRASVSYPSTSSPHNPRPNVDSSYPHSANDSYTPDTSETLGVATPDSASSGQATYTTPQGPYGYHQNTGGGLPDFSAMMFPTGDPFAYPKQPMITLENSNCMVTKQEPMFGKESDNLYNISPTTSNPPYENLEAQLFGPLPPYMMQGPQSGLRLPNMASQMNMSTPGGDANMMSVDGQFRGWEQFADRTGLTPGLNLDEIFGQDWKGSWMEPGYGG